MVETPRLQAKRKWAKCEQSEDEPNMETNATILSYPRKRVSSGFFFQILSWIPAGVYPVAERGRNDEEEGIRTEVDLKSTYFWNPSPSRRGRIQF